VGNVQFLTCKTAVFSAAPPVKMPSIENSFPINDSRLPHPVLNSNCAHEELKQLLLSLSKKPEYAAHRSTLRSAADRVREKAFGYNRSTTKRKITKLLTEFHCLELEDFIAETGIAPKEVNAAIEELIVEGKIRQGKRRRWQEPGKHFNPLYELAVTKL
jgi:hypothetical protein